MTEQTLNTPRLRHFFARRTERDVERVAWAMCALFALGLLWQLAHLIWRMIPHHDVTQPTNVAQNTAAPSNTTTTQSITKWHLFGNAETPPPSAQATAVSNLAFRLRGTWAEADPKAGIAMIDNGSAGERAYRVGEDIVEGVHLIAVYRGWVTLSRQGHEEILKLPKPEETTPAVATANINSAVPTSATHRTGNGAASQAPTTGSSSTPTKANQAHTSSMTRTNVEDLAKRAQILPVIENGKISGARFSSTTDPALMNQLGLRPTDVVTAVNGTPLNSVANGQKLMDTMKNVGQVDITVQRDGRPIQLTVNLNQ